MSNLFNDQGFVQANVEVNSGSVVCVSLDQGLTAAGSTYAGALPLVSNINVLGTVASGTGVSLPAGAPPGAKVDVINLGSHAVLPYPPLGGILNGGSINAAGGTIAATSGVGHFVSLGGNGYVSN
jgi:hypothetical protein